MKIKITNIYIQDFRGVALCDIDFKENKTVLLAPFGSGKTTIKEAFLWGFGLPILNIKPCKFENQRWVEIPHTNTNVNLKLILDQEEIILKRSDKNGTTKFSINDEDIKTLKDYQKRILELLGLENIETLKDLVIVGNFMQRENKEIRKMLIELSKANESLIEVQNSYDTLKQDFTNGLTTEEISLNIKREIKKVEEEQTALQTKIETYKEFIKTHELDSQELESTKEAVLQSIKETKKEMEDIISVVREKYERATKELENSTKEHESQNILLGNEIQQARTQITILERPIQVAKEKIETIEAREIDKVFFCPTCHQPLPNGNEVQKKLEEKKQEDLEKAKNELQELLAEQEKWKTISETKRQELKVLEESNTTHELYRIYLGLKERYNNVEQQIAPQKDFLNNLENELIEINANIKAQEIVEEQKTNLTEAQKQLRQLLTKIQNIYKKSDDLKDYTSKIENVITKCVNDFFLSNETGLSWKLYENAKNGNLQTTAELMYKNYKQYSYCSRGEQLDANCQLLFFLQDTFNLDLPIFIDNITDLGGKTFDKTDKQIIYLQTDNKNHNFEIEQY